MNSTSTDLFTAALALPDAERLALATKLWSSLRPPNVLSEDDPGFAAEILRRCEAVDSGEVELIEHDEAMRILWQRQAARQQARSDDA